MRRFSPLVLFGLLLASRARAEEPRLGDRGTREVGGSAFILTGRSTVKDSGATASGSTTQVSVNPQLGYFVSDGLEVIGSALMGSESDSGIAAGTLTRLGLNFGGGYYIRASTGFLVGPDVTIGFFSKTTKSSAFTFSESGPAISAGGTLKFPIGQNAFLNAGLHLKYDTLFEKINDGSGGTGSQTLVETYVVPDLGFTVVF